MTKEAAKMTNTTPQEALDKIPYTAISNKAREAIRQTLTEHEKLKAENAALREALDRIASPIMWMQKDAKKEGFKLNGAVALELAMDASFLSDIAKNALNAATIEESK